MTSSNVLTLPSCMYGAVTAMLRNVGTRNLPTSCIFPVNRYSPVFGSGYEERPRRLYKPVFLNGGSGGAAPLYATAPFRFQPPWHWKHPVRSPEKKRISPRFAESLMALASPSYLYRS